MPPQIAITVRAIAEQVSGKECSVTDVSEHPNCFWISGPRQNQGAAIPRLLVMIELSEQTDLVFAQLSADAQRAQLDNLKAQLAAAWKRELEHAKAHPSSTEPKFIVDPELLGL